MDGNEILRGAKMRVAEDFGKRSESRGCAEEGRSVQATFFAAREGMKGRGPDTNGEDAGGRFAEGEVGELRVFSPVPDGVRRELADASDELAVPVELVGVIDHGHADGEVGDGGGV